MGGEEEETKWGERRGIQQQKGYWLEGVIGLGGLDRVLASPQPASGQ